MHAITSDLIFSRRWSFQLLSSKLLQRAIWFRKRIPPPSSVPILNVRNSLAYYKFPLSEDYYMNCMDLFRMWSVESTELSAHWFRRCVLYRADSVNMVGTCRLSLQQKKTNKLHGLSPRANYTDRATAACWRSDCQLLRIKGATWSAWQISTAVFSVF
jgi:hypothetical protein